MKKYKITTSAIVEYKYIVKANSGKEAEKKFWETDYDECTETPNQNVNTEEEIISTEELEDGWKEI